MQKFTSYVSGIVALIFLLGCSYQFEIHPEELKTAHPVFKFSKPALTSPLGVTNRIALTSLLVVKKTDNVWDYSHPEWAFELRPGSSLEVAEVHYGTVPPGFRETTAAKLLLIGVMYQVVGFGPGSGGRKNSC